ncbi:MAG TPA: FAD-dependent oxidoreductase [Phototrophicaceae bacterium]|nr:FAD-dependent oxidoreductase [Phototrophicaceae bacterium]
MNPPEKKENSLLFGQWLTGAARLVAKTWPVARHLFPERLEIDDNRSFWVSQTPDYQPGPPLRQTVAADLAIIGGGFTGVSTAYHFSRRYPDKRVVLLEAKTLANGASGRNGGLMLNWLADNPDHGPEMTARIYQTTLGGIQTIRDIIQRHQLPVQYRYDGTLTVYTDPGRAATAQAETEYHNSLGIPEQFLDKAALTQKMKVQGAYGAVLDPNSGQINGAQLVRSLRPVLTEQGVEIYENTPVLAIQEGATIRLTTPEGEVNAKAIVLATNGYTSKLGYFQDALFPLHSHVFATAPLTLAQERQMGWQQYAGYCDDYDRISYAGLTTDGHLIFGGGSNQSYAYLFNNRTAYPGTPNAAVRSFDTMRQTLRDYFPGSGVVPVAYRWTGTLGITLNRTALMGVRGEQQNIYYAIGYCGHGVTLANLAGQILTDLYSRDDQQWRGLPFYQNSYVPIPPEPFRWIGYQAFTRLTGRSPRVS